MLDKDVRGLTGENIAEHPAAHARQDADEYQKERTALRIEKKRVPDPHDGKYAQTNRVHDQQADIEQTLFVHQRAADIGNEKKHRGADCHQRTGRVAEGKRGRDAQNEVAEDPAADGCDHTQHDDAEQIHMLFHGDQRTRSGKGDGADQLENFYK